MTVCPNGHDSVSDDFCDVCGMRLAGAPETPATPAVGLSAKAGAHRADQPAGGSESCPRCGTVRSGKFCEACGFNFGNPRLSPPFTPAGPSFTPAPSFVPAGPSFTPAPSFIPAGLPSDSGFPPAGPPADPGFPPAGPSGDPGFPPARPSADPGFPPAGRPGDAGFPPGRFSADPGFPPGRFSADPGFPAGSSAGPGYASERSSGDPGRPSADSGYAPADLGSRPASPPADFGPRPVSPPADLGSRPASPPADPGYPPSRPRFTPAGPSYTPDGLSYSPAQPDLAPGPSAPSGPPAPPAPSVLEAAPPGASSSFPYPQITWTAVVGADRDYYEQVQAVSGPEGAAVAFPSSCAERRFALMGNQMRIGRRSVSRGLSPEIDLTGPPADPGISRLHAVLVAVPDGSWAVLDPGSANGTLVNGTEIPVGDQVTLHDGDRINLGAWTIITVHQDGP